jgi:hypothetical protein
MDIEAERGPLGVVAIGSEASEQVDEEVDGARGARVLDLADVLVLIDDGLNERALAQEQVVRERDEDVAHVLAQLGDESQLRLKEEALSERGGDGALVAKEASKELVDQAWNGLAVVAVARVSQRASNSPWSLTTRWSLRP